MKDPESLKVVNGQENNRAGEIAKFRGQFSLLPKEILKLTIRKEATSEVSQDVLLALAQTGM